MRNIGRIIFTLIIFLTITSSAFAENEPVPVTGSVDGGGIDQEISEDIEGIIDGNISLASISMRQFTPINLLADNDYVEPRICPYCSAFAVGYLIFLVYFGFRLKRLKKQRKLGKHWFGPVVIVGLLTYLLHAVVHTYFAATIFLDYYWIVLFDELLVAYIAYLFIVKPKSVNRKRCKSLKRGV